MSRSSGRPLSRRPSRAQVEPLAALSAVFAVGLALSAYAGVLDATLPTYDRNLAEPTVERVERAVCEARVADPGALDDGLRAGPDGYRLNLTLAAAGERWHAGPPAPPTADSAESAVGVRVGPGRVRSGRLRVEVWT